MRNSLHAAALLSLSTFISALAVVIALSGCRPEASKGGSTSPAVPLDAKIVGDSAAIRVTAVDFAVPAMQTIPIEIPEIASGSPVEFIFDVTGIERGQLLLTALRTFGGDCPGIHILSAAYLLRYNASAQVESMTVLQVMEPAGIVPNARYAVVVKSTSAALCRGGRVELDVIGFRSRSDSSGDALPLPTSPPTPDATPTPDPTSGPTASPTPSPTPGPTPRPTDTPGFIGSSPVNKAEVIAFGTRSAAEGCKFLWRSTIGELMIKPGDPGLKIDAEVDTTGANLVKVIQRNQNLVLNLFWLHGLDSADQEDLAKELRRGEKIAIGPAGEQCAAAVEANPSSAGRKFFELSGPESLLMFSGDPASACLRAKEGTNGVSGSAVRGDWTAVGDRRFSVAYRLSGSGPSVDIRFDLADEAQAQKLREPGFLFARIYSEKIHAFVSERLPVDLTARLPHLPTGSKPAMGITVKDRLLLKRMLRHWRTLHIVLESPAEQSDLACRRAVRVPLGDYISDSALIGNFTDKDQPNRRPESLSESDLQGLQEEAPAVYPAQQIKGTNQPQYSPEPESTP